MPGGARWRWSDEPFSYTKLCYTVPGIVICSWLFLSGIGWDAWLPKSNFLCVVVVGLIAVAAYVFFLTVVWDLLPNRIRERTPFDQIEAERLKGDVRSFWDLCKLILWSHVD